MPLELVLYKIIRNSVFNSIGHIWATGVAFVLTPYIVRRLGAEQYGMWILILAWLSYVGLLDLGLGEAVIKYLAEYAALKNWVDARQLMGTGLAFYLMLSICLVGITWGLRIPVLTIFKIPLSHWEESGVVLLCAVLSLCLANVAGLFQSALIGIQRMDALNLIAVVTVSVNGLATVVVLETGHGLIGLALVTAGTMALKAIVLWAAVGLLKRELRILSFAFAWRKVRIFLAYGTRIQITNLGAVVNLEAPKLLLGYFLGLSFVTVYEIGFKVAYSLASLLMVLLVAIVPAASELATHDDRMPVRQLYRWATRYIVLLASPLGSLTIVCAPALLLVWMGPGYEASIGVVRALTVAFTLSIVLTGVGTAVARGTNRPGLETRYALVVIAVQLALGILLAMQFGMTGVLMATVIATLLGSSYFLYTMHRYLGESILSFVRQGFAVPVLGCLAAGGLAWLVGIQLYANLLPITRLGGGITLLVQSAAFMITYAAVVVKAGYISLHPQTVSATPPT